MVMSGDNNYIDAVIMDIMITVIVA